jgi:Flagellar hook-length control protein FliK
VRVFLDPAMLKAELPTLVLRPGMSLAARVAETRGNRGLLMIAGAALAAELPDGVRAGDTLKLRVQEATSDRIVMRMETDPPPVPMVPLPGGQAGRIEVKEDQEGSQVAGGTSQVAITYRSPALGAIDFQLAVEGGSVTAHVRAREGAPFELARAQAEELRDALHRASGKPVQLTVNPRHDPLDVYA